MARLQVVDELWESFKGIDPDLLARERAREGRRRVFSWAAVCTLGLIADAGLVYLAMHL